MEKEVIAFCFYITVDPDTGRGAVAELNKAKISRVTGTKV